MNGKREKWDAQQNRNRTSKGQSGGWQNFCSLAFSSSSFFFFFFSSSFLWTRISEYPHGRALVKVFSGGEGGFSFQKKGSVGHSLPSVTLVSSLVVELFCKRGERKGRVGGGGRERGEGTEREREVVKGAQEEKLVGAAAILTTMHARTQASSGVSIYYLA